MKRILFCIVLVTMLALSGMAQAKVKLHKAGTYASGVFDESAAEIVAYDRDTMRVFVVNANSGKVDVLDVSDITRPKLIKVLDFSRMGKAVNSVDSMNGMLAVAVENRDKQAPGFVVLTDVNGKTRGVFRVGALPDMVTFTPDGNYVVCACEGEPNDDYTNDPEGSVAIINVKRGSVRIASFAKYNPFRSLVQRAGIRISHPKATVAQDVEPEYVAVSSDSKYAFVAMQENNALAKVDIARAEVVDLLPLGLKDWAGNGWRLDASDKDGGVNISEWPVFSAYMPDAIAAYTGADGKTYIITANEGDSREYGDYEDEKRFAKARLDGSIAEYAKLQDEKALGRLKTIPDLSDTDMDGDYDRIVAFGGRSFSIWDEHGNLVFDSGDEFEMTTAAQYYEWFNASNDDHAADKRSDDKGSEPEAVTTGMINGRTYAFIGLERMGGIMVYDVTEPGKSEFVEYRTDRNFMGDPEKGEAGDLGPEGFKFVPVAKSHTGTNLLIVGSEVSGTTTIYEVK